MKMAKPSERDIDAAGNLLSLLYQIDRGDYPNLDEDANVPDWFDEDNFDHLRAFYDAIKATLDKGPGYPGRVIGGMCYVIMWDKNEIVDPASDTIDLHPKIVRALELAESAQAAPKTDGASDSIHSHPIGAPDQQQIEWSHVLQSRLIEVGKDQDRDVQNIMAEAACLLAALTGRTSTDQANADTGSAE